MAARPSNLPTSQHVTSKLNKITHGVSGAFQRAGSVIISGLRSCDDTTDVLAANNELFVGSRKPGAWGQELLNHNHPTVSLQLATLARPVDTIEPRIWGTHEFKVSMTWQTRESSRRPSSPASDGRHDFGGLVVVTAWMETAGPGGKKELPIEVRWKRKCAGLTFPINYSGTKFPVTADDVSCSVFAEVTSMIGDMGTAFCEMGPFDIDASMSATIQGYLAANGSTFSVSLGPVQDAVMDSILDSDDRCLVLYISSSEIKLTRPGPNNIGFTHHWTAAVTGHQTLVSVDLSNATLFTLHFDDTSSANAKTVKPHSLKVCALSRRQRDTIVLTIRAFQAQKVVVSSVLLEQIAINTNSKFSGNISMANDDQNVTSPQNATELDFYLIFEQLSRQLLELLETSSKSQRERNRAVAERDALEQDMDATIEIYKKLLADQISHDTTHPLDKKPASGLKEEEGISDLTALLGGKEDITGRAVLMAALQVQLKESQEQCRKYLEDLETLRRDHSQLKSRLQEKETQLRAWMESPVTSRTDEIDEQRMAKLEKQIRHLEQLNFTLKNEDTKKSNEIRELRQSIQHELQTTGGETLTAAQLEVQKLRKEIESLVCAKEEAEKNFLYIKARFDESEQRQRDLVHSRVEVAESLERLERSSQREVQSYKDRALEFETRLETQSMQVRELENEVCKLNKEKNNLERSLERSRRDLSENTGKLADLNQTLLFGTSGIGACSEMNSIASTNVGALRNQLNAKNLEIEELKRENEKLRARLQKALQAS